jgi:hypothetical protein
MLHHPLRSPRLTAPAGSSRWSRRPTRSPALLLLTEETMATVLDGSRSTRKVPATRPCSARSAGRFLPDAPSIRSCLTARSPHDVQLGRGVARRVWQRRPATAVSYGYWLTRTKLLLADAARATRHRKPKKRRRGAGRDLGPRQRLPTTRPRPGSGPGSREERRPPPTSTSTLHPPPDAVRAVVDAAPVPRYPPTYVAASGRSFGCCRRAGGAGGRNASQPRAARPASRRAMGTRNGEQDT